VAEQTHYRAYLCFGPNCGPKGTGALLDFLEGELERTGLGDAVTVLPTGCQSHCETGPTMVVYPGPVYYQEMSIEKLTRVVAEHFGQGMPVRDYLWKGVKRKILPTGERKSTWTLPPLRTTTPEPQRAPTKRERPKPEVDDFKW